MDSKQQDIRIWCAISKNGTLLTFIDEPKRDEQDEYWTGHPYCNSVAYKYLMNLLGDQLSQLSFDNEPFFITLEYKE